MDKRKIGRIIYVLLVVLLIYFGFIKPAMDRSNMADNTSSTIAATEAEDTVELPVAPTEEGTDTEEVIDTEEVLDDEEATTADDVSKDEEVSDETDDGDVQIAEESVDDTSEGNSAEDNVDRNIEELPEKKSEDNQKADLLESGTYTSKEEVALYLHTYNHLPSNYITKNEAEDRGWKTKGKGTMDKACPGMSIGGDRFGNREGNLPKAKNRQYYECDIDYEKGNRNSKRIVYSNDGLIFYTEDHYETFEQLY